MRYLLLSIFLVTSTQSAAVECYVETLDGGNRFIELNMAKTRESRDVCVVEYERFVICADRRCGGAQDDPWCNLNRDQIGRHVIYEYCNAEHNIGLVE